MHDDPNLLCVHKSKDMMILVFRAYYVILISCPLHDFNVVYSGF